MELIFNGGERFFGYKNTSINRQRGGHAKDVVSRNVGINYFITFL